MAARRADLPWDVQLCLRGWCRLRAGLATLRAVNGRRSQARFQSCIFCDRPTRNATVHALALCPPWEERRREFRLAASLGDCSAQALALAVLRCHPSSQGFVEGVRLADAIDSASLLGLRCLSGFPASSAT